MFGGLVRRYGLGGFMRIGRQRVGCERLGSFRGCKECIVFDRAGSAALGLFFSSANGFDFQNL